MRALEFPIRNLREAPTFLERLLNMLKCLAALFRMLGDAFAEWAGNLNILIRELDKGYPAWRAIT